MNQVQSSLNFYQQERVKRSYEDGQRAASTALRRVRAHRQKLNEEEESGIENLIKQ